VIPTFELMHPTQVPEPFHRPGWVYEEKVDGWRMAAYKDGKRVRLISRSGVDHSGRFPELVAAVASLAPRTLVLDGEVAVFDRQLRSRFDWLRDPDPEAVATPPVLMVFDLLYRAGRDLTKLPLRDRRARLEAVGRRRSYAPGSPARGKRPRCVGPGARYGLRGHGGEGRRECVHRWPDQTVAQSQSAWVDR
jgi:ATP-dependent DNA ligase